MLSRYRGKTTCKECNGNRLKPEASYVKINGKSITDLVGMPIENLLKFMLKLKLDTYEKKIANRILKEIQNRLSLFVMSVLDILQLTEGLALYLEANRKE